MLFCHVRGREARAILLRVAVKQILFASAAFMAISPLTAVIGSDRPPSSGPGGMLVEIWALR
jgi:hypothetical protein